MSLRTREQLEQWARWRHYRYGGYGKTMTEKCLEGMPGTHCPNCGGSGKRAKQVCTTCYGAGRVLMLPSTHHIHTTPCTHCERGEVKGRTCVICRGSGFRTRVETLINPANIRSTYQSPDDPVSQRIDRLVCELKQRDVLLGYFFVVWAEYCDARGGTQASKAQRLLLTQKCYESRLYRAVTWIGKAVQDRRSCDAIPFPYKSA